MKGIFRFDGPVFTICSKVTDILWLNILYIICSLPVITIGASTTSLYYVTLKMARNEEGYVTRTFFKGFKENFKKSTIIWLIFMAFIYVLSVDVRILNNEELRASLGGTASYMIFIAGGILGLILLLVFIYVFPLIAQFENTVVNTIKNAFFMSIKHVISTLVMLLIMVLPFILIMVNPKLLIGLLISFALTAYINSYILNKIFSFYMDDEVIETDNMHVSD